MNPSNRPVVRHRGTKRRDKVAELVAREMLFKIREARLGPGSQLPTEAHMIEEYAVGRATLREALRILEIPGLISIKPGPGGGPVVEDVSSEHFGRMATLFFQAAGMTYRELIEARLILEPVTARLAAERSDTASRERLCILAATEYTDDESDYLRTSRDFHAEVVAMSGNGVVALFSQALADIFRDRVSGILFPTSRRRKGVVDTHASIADAISDGRAGDAERLMFEHMEQYVKYVKSKHPSLIDEVVDWR